MIPDYEAVLAALLDDDVDFVVIGAVALVLHGSPRVTRDLDICYARESANLDRLASALGRFTPTLRGAPAGLPFRLDAPTLRGGLNFTLTSSAGDIDLLGEVAGLGGFPVVNRMSVIRRVYGRDVRVLSLDGLERAKRAAGRLTDLADLEEIIRIRQLTRTEEGT
jgi:hypothetical protein